MINWIESMKVSDLDRGTAKSVMLEHGQTKQRIRVALFNLDGEYFALEDVCTHDGGEIANGCIFGETIECPRHGARFDIKSGKIVSPPATEPIQVVSLRVEGNSIYLREDWWNS